MGCNKNCCSMIDDLLEQIQEGLGKVDYEEIDAYIDEKIEELREAIIDGDISATVDIEALAEQLKDIIKDDQGLVDAYNVTYKNINVGKKLDELSKVIDYFDGHAVNTLRPFVKGETVYNTPVFFEFNKPLKKLSASVYVNDMNISTVDLDVNARRFDIPVLSGDTQIVIKATSKDDEVASITYYANFHLKYYVGCSGAENISNTEVINLNSYIAYEGKTKYSHIFHPIGKQYLWWAFPVDLHTDYDFFNNGFMDSDYVWKTGNLTNEYGYTSTYLFVRSGNPHTSNNIYTEVKAHEHK